MTETRLPDFLVLGAQKAGTTWFTRNLRSHPEISMPLDELRYFTRNYELGTDWYASHFADAQPTQLLGEGTPGYLWQQPAAERIAHTLGSDVRLIACVREPVSRAYSSFWNLLGGGLLPVDASFVDEFANDTNGLRTRGLYADQLERFIDLFGTSQLLVFVTELDLGANGPETLRRTFDFVGASSTYMPETAKTRANIGGGAKLGGARMGQLGIAVARRADALPRPVERIMRRGYAAAHRRLPLKRAFEPLDPTVREQCSRVFSKDVDRLEHLLDRDLSPWRT